MAVFALYKYDFTTASEGALFAIGEEKSVLEKAQETFEGATKVNVAAAAEKVVIVKVYERSVKVRR